MSSSVQNCCHQLRPCCATCYIQTDVSIEDCAVLHTVEAIAVQCVLCDVCALNAKWFAVMLFRTVNSVV